MITYHTPPASLADALTALADRMERFDGPIGHVAFANMMATVLDGPAGNAWRATEHPELAKEMQDALASEGFLSPVPTVDQVRHMAATSRSQASLPKDPAMAATVFYRSTTTGVRIRIDDKNATIDLGENPHYPNIKRATELAITYETTEKRDREAVQKTSEVSRIVYVLDDEDTPSAFVHPDYLNQPQDWPEWVREQVEKHRPAE
ncbi:hypothetical protein ACFV6B_13305 [Streptomyces microflavus]|uniref:hypothetical protein n=1 Tax=Streptomyces microflavus TaxID=1919 RepID=UPI003659E817